ncbi:glutaminyl-peptide cyclotransferase isoform X1 [Octopus sinensis]|uniref:Glutaminyl-peptide cyclotransferase n=1 Tax=Octopus sinensis TaxID=2607531 RepID=A0A6P7SXF9_9MOLL|nr:glutaminyl-peptide cyclotransferase isoform X1 [Octopus sinensis]
MAWSYLTILFVFIGSLVFAEKKLYGENGMKNLTKLGNFSDFWNLDLEPILIPRVSGTPGNIKVREHIISRLESLKSWTITEDKFVQQTPNGKVKFSDIIATLDPKAHKQVVLACHYDSKKFYDFEFIGATDSAVPCALLLALVRELQCLFKYRQKNLDTTLQLIFFDGEEAFKTWTETDSLYGSRHLASKWQNDLDANGRNKLYSITHFILLDLIGSSNIVFHNYFPQETDRLFQNLVKIEHLLLRRNLQYRDHYNMYKSMFSTELLQFPLYGIQDDHVPFAKKGVKILHLIPYPFPSIWHQPGDIERNLDKRSIANFKNVLTVFVAHYLKLPSWHRECSSRFEK